MGRFKNIRLNKICSLCLIGCLIFNTATIKAYADSSFTEAIESVVTNISDLNNADNLGNMYKINATVICAYDEKILVNDGTGELWIVLDGITIENINIEDKIFATGILNQLDDKIVLSVTNAESIGVIEDTDDDEVLPDDEETLPDEGGEAPDHEEGLPDNDVTSPDDVPTPDNDKVPELPNNNENSSGGTGTNKPSTNTSKPSLNMNQNSEKPDGSTNNNSSNKPSSNDSNVEVYTGPIIKSNGEIVVTEDLTSSQWDEIQAAYEAKEIKIKELDNNRLRITKVSKEYGDTIWIVKDPRKSDVEEALEQAFTVGLSTIKSIDYTTYDVSETQWNSIIDSVSNGTAKFKVLDDYLEIIYPSASSADYILTINKKDL